MSAEASPRTARRRKTRWAVAALAMVALIAAGAVFVPMWMRGGAAGGAAVASSAVETGELVVTASANGQTEPVESYDVYPEVDGTVATMDVAVGDRVGAGDTLFTVGDEALKGALRQASAQLKQADQQVAQAKQQLEQARLQRLQASNKLDKLKSQTGTRTASADDLEEAKKDVSVANAGVASANAGLASAHSSRSNAAENYADAKADLDRTTVTSPASGVVTAVNVSEGGAVSAGGGASGGSGGATDTGSSAGGSAPVVIADISALKVTVAVNEVDIADVKAGQEATVTFDAIEDLEVPAKVSWVSPNAGTSGSVATYDIELELSAQDERLRPGMTATADITTLKVAEAVLIPKSSVKTGAAEKYVMVISESGAQERRIITTGPSDDTRVQVLTGLRAGEQIATAASSSTSAQDVRGGAFMMDGPPPGAGRQAPVETRGGN